MFQFSVALAGHDMINDTRRVTTCRFKGANAKPQDYKKIKRTSENNGLSKKIFEDLSHQKKSNIYSRNCKINPTNEKPLKVAKKQGHSDKDGKKTREINKQSDIQIKTLGFLQDSSLTFSTFVKSWLVGTWSRTLAGLPRADANLKPHFYKKLQKTKKLPKTWVLFKNHLKNSDKNEQESIQAF